jgi:hypothetical protein
MRITHIAGHDIPLKANQSSKMRYMSEFHTSLTSDLNRIILPFADRLDDIESAKPGDLLALVAASDVDIQGILSQMLWACAWSADRQTVDYDQWSQRLQDEDEDALGLFSGDGIADWVTQTVEAVVKAFLGLDLTLAETTGSDADKS